MYLIYKSDSVLWSGYLEGLTDYFVYPLSFHHGIYFQTSVLTERLFSFYGICVFVHEMNMSSTEQKLACSCRIGLQTVARTP